MDRDDSLVILYQAINTLLSNHFNDAQEDVRQVIRQAGLTNLWFYLKFIAGYSGPFTKLTDHLHAEVCNHYQLQYERPGSKGGVFLGRSHYKTTVVTPGANGWECTRNPNIQIAAVSAVQERAQEFLATTQEIFTKNEFVQWLYPEHYVANPRNLKNWNKDSMTLPNKTRDFSKPNIRAIGALGSTQGIHVDLFKVDDPVGEDMLNADRQAGAMMRRVENWMFGSFRTLLVDPTESRIYLAGTRYGEEDAFRKVFNNAYEVHGCPEEFENDLNPNGEWSLYWRPARTEDRRITFPENFTNKFLDDILAEDPWSYFNQYINKVKNSIRNEFREYDVVPMSLDRSVRNSDWMITIQESPYEPTETIPLSQCDVVIAVDPAASEKKTSALTSRTAIGVLATDYKGRRFVVDVRADYIPSTTLFDWIFEFYALYPTARIVVLEQQGPFKTLGPLLTKEAVERRVRLPLVSSGASVEKDARIRTTLQPLLFARRIFARESQAEIIRGELVTFPDGKLKDTLDMLSTAINASIVPPHTPHEGDWDEDDEAPALSFVGRDPYTGY
jgi:hypothetical protein